MTLSLEEVKKTAPRTPGGGGGRALRRTQPTGAAYAKALREGLLSLFQELQASQCGWGPAAEGRGKKGGEQAGGEKAGPARILAAATTWDYHRGGWGPRGSLSRVT